MPVLETLPRSLECREPLNAGLHRRTARLSHLSPAAPAEGKLTRVIARSITIAVGLLAIVASQAWAQASGPVIHQQRSDTLEIAPQLNPQQTSRLPVPRSRPTPAAPERILIVPQASRDFVGHWGGHLRLAKVTGKINPPPDTVVSLTFGEKRGEVFMRTMVYATAGANVLKTDAEVLNPRELQIRLDGFEIFHEPPIRHVEKLKLALTDRGTIKVAKRVRLYVRGFSTPMAEANYEGTLHPISTAEELELQREVMQRGAMPQATIRARGPAWLAR